MSARSSAQHTVMAAVPALPAAAFHLILACSSSVAPLPLSVAAGKPAGDDKRLGKQLERQISEELAHSPSLSPSVSPLGPLTDSSTRRLLISLITTMNASFPDYDFSNLRAEQFEREISPYIAVTSLNVSSERRTAASLQRRLPLRLADRSVPGLLSVSVPDAFGADPAWHSR